MKDNSRPLLVEADAQVNDSGKIGIKGISLTAGSDLATLIIYNEATGDKTSAKKVLTLKAAANTTVEHHTPFYLDEGCYADISGTSPTATIFIK